MNSSSMGNNNFAITTGIWTAGFSCLGYAGALMAGADPWLTAKAFAIAVIVDAIFCEVIEKKYKENENDPLKNKIFLVWKSLGGALAIAAFRNVGIISDLGVKIFSGLLVAVNILVLYRHVREDKYLYVNHTPKKQG